MKAVQLLTQVSKGLYTAFSGQYLPVAEVMGRPDDSQGTCTIDFDTLTVIIDIATAPEGIYAEVRYEHGIKNPMSVVATPKVALPASEVGVMVLTGIVKQLAFVHVGLR